MRSVEFPALEESDRSVVDRYAAGLAADAATVLAYLVLRRDLSRVEDHRATQVAVRIGTGLGRTAVTDALSELEDRGYVSQTTVESSGDGRPPKAWHATDDSERMVERVYNDHAGALLERAVALSDPDPAGERDDTPDENGPRDTTGEADPSETPAGVTVGINWSPNALHTPLYEAREGGSYARRDVEVAFEHHRGSHRVLDTVVAGDIDVGLVGAGTVSRARERDVPVVPVAVLYQRAMTVLYTARERFGETLESVDQLPGCRVGTAVGSETCLLARLFLSYADLLKDIRLVDVEGEEHEALLADTVDIATGTFADPDAVDERGLTVDVLSITDHFPIYGPTFVVRTDALTGTRPRLGRFLAGTMEGWVEAREGARAGVEAIAARTDEPAGDVSETFERAVEEFGLSDQVKKHGWGWQRPETWERLHTALTQGDVLSDPV